MPQVQKLTEKREKSIDKFLKEFTIEQFEQICKIANLTNFLIGENDNGWKADFDFLIRVDKATSILEGKYNTNNTKNKCEHKEEKFIEIDTSQLTQEEYGKLVRGEITTKELIEKGRIHV